VSKPPAVDFEAEGLLDGLEGEARRARLQLLEELRERGVSLDYLRRACEEDRLLFVPSELLIGGLPKYTARELSELVDLSPEFLSATRRAHGLPVPDPDEVAYTEADVASAHTGRAFRLAGLEEQDMIEITRILGRGFGQAAEAMRALVLKMTLEPGASERDFALRHAELVARLMPLTGPMLSQMLTLHLRHMVRGEAISAAEREQGRLPGAREVSVGFADLVGFTRMGEELPVDELGRVAGRLEQLATDTARAPVRLVKTIGDAAMLASPDAAPLILSALDLIDAADAEGPDFPQLRVGLARGQAVSRAGDWYGRPVNLASRITGIAHPGSVLATLEVRDAVTDAFRWSATGHKHLRGIRQPLRLYRARRREPGPEPGPDPDPGPGLGLGPGPEPVAR
jgi:adenylate cyclase